VPARNTHADRDPDLNHHFPGSDVRITFDREELPAGEGKELYERIIAHIRRGQINYDRAAQGLAKRLMSLR
jgi:hypothetical protein